MQNADFCHFRLHHLDKKQIEEFIKNKRFSRGVYESTAFRIIQKTENILIKSGIFKFPGKKKLIDSDRSLKTIVIDVTESPIERPKKTK